MASQITGVSMVYSTVYSGADQRNHQRSASLSLAFVWGIHRWPANSPHKWPATQKMFPFDDVIMKFASPVKMAIIPKSWLKKMTWWKYIMYHQVRDAFPWIHTYDAFPKNTYICMYHPTARAAVACISRGGLYTDPLWGKFTGHQWISITKGHTVKPACNDHLYNKLIACDLFSNVF